MFQSQRFSWYLMLVKSMGTFSCFLKGSYGVFCCFFGLLSESTPPYAGDWQYIETICQWQ